jgi:hypothetical protein
MELEIDRPVKAGGDLLDPLGDAYVDARSGRHDADLDGVCGHAMAPGFRSSCQAPAIAVVIAEWTRTSTISSAASAAAACCPWR